MPQRQLNIRSDEAYRRASDLAARLGKSTTEVVVEALRSYESGSPPRHEQDWSPEARRRFEALQAAAAEARGHLVPGTPEGHDWLYDENGLPR